MKLTRKFRANRDIVLSVLGMTLLICLLCYFDIARIQDNAARDIATYRQTLLDSYDLSIKREVQTVISQITAYYERAQRGK